MQHIGDLGNILADATGRATFRKIDRFLKISDIIGRSLVITNDSDDLGKGDNPESKINGNSGIRYKWNKLLHIIILLQKFDHYCFKLNFLFLYSLACGIIARSSGLFQNTKKICACDGLTIWDERDRALANHGIKSYAKLNEKICIIL